MRSIFPALRLQLYDSLDRMQSSSIEDAGNLIEFVKEPHPDVSQSNF